MKFNTLLLFLLTAVLLSSGIVFAADDHENLPTISIFKAPIFHTYTKITKELDDTKPTLQECYDLYNPVRIINDIYTELQQEQEKKSGQTSEASYTNLFLKWVFAQRFHYKLSGKLISVTNYDSSDSLKMLMNAKQEKEKMTAKKNVNAKKSVVAKNSTETLKSAHIKKLREVLMKEKFSLQDNTLKPIWKFFGGKAELQNLDERISQIVSHILTFPSLNKLPQTFPFSQAISKEATLLGISEALCTMTNSSDIKNQALAVKGGCIHTMNCFGMLALQKGELEKAENWYREAISKGSKEAMNNLADLLLKKGKLEEAEKWYRAAISKGSKEAMINLANLLYKKGNLKEAEKWFRVASSVGNLEAMNSLADLLYEKGDLKEAEKCYREAISKGSKKAIINLADLLKEKGDLEEAEKCYREAILKGNKEAINNFANLLQEKGDLKEAEKWYRVAISQNSIESKYNLALLLKHQSELDVPGKAKKIEEAKTLLTETLNKGVSLSLISLAELSSTAEEKESYLQEAIRRNVPYALIYYADFLKQQGRVLESDKYHDLHEEDFEETIKDSTESNSKSPSDSEDEELPLIAVMEPNISTLSPCVEQPIIIQLKEKYVAPTPSKKQQKKWIRMEQQAEKAKEESQKALLIKKQTNAVLKTYKDIKVTALPDATAEIGENELKVQSLISRLTNGETKRANFEFLQNQDNLCSMRITKGDRLVFKITEGNLETGITAIKIIAAKGHYSTLDARATQMTQEKPVQWSNFLER